MKPRLSARDEQLLSDFLDGQLSGMDAAAFETRLKEDSVLSEAAGDLRRLKTELRRLPRYPLPRNFTLTPDMVQKRRPAGPGFWLSAMRFASIAAVFLLAAVYTLEYLSGGVPNLRGRPANPAAETTAMREEAANAFEASPPPIIIWNNPAYGRGGGPGAPQAAPLQKGAAGELATAAEAPVAEPQMDLSAETPGEAQGSLAPAATLSVQAAPFPAETLPAPPAENAAPGLQTFAAGGGAPPPAGETLPAGSTPYYGGEEPLILGLAPADQGTGELTPQAVEKTGPERQSADDRQEGDQWLWIKAVLAMTALSTATAAVLIRRKVRM